MKRNESSQRVSHRQDLRSRVNKCRGLYFLDAGGDILDFAGVAVQRGGDAVVQNQ